jgi:hypothetical protein
MLGELRFAISNQIDDSLMRFDILSPGRSPLAICAYSKSDECEKGPEKFLRIGQDMGISGNAGEFKVESKIASCQRFAIVSLRRTSHFAYDLLETANFRLD